jgi:hypothetical protein
MYPNLEQTLFFQLNCHVLAYCLVIVEATTSHTPMGIHGLLK